MNQEQQEYKRFLQEQVEWCKKQDSILEKIEVRLHQMKGIAEYSTRHDLTQVEIDELNGQLKELESEVHILEKQLQSVVH